MSSFEDSQALKLKAIFNEDFLRNAEVSAEKETYRYSNSDKQHIQSAYKVVHIDYRWIADICQTDEQTVNLMMKEFTT